VDGWEKFQSLKMSIQLHIETLTNQALDSNEFYENLATEKFITQNFFSI
jgi:hypothetical protein